VGGQHRRVFVARAQSLRLTAVIQGSADSIAFWDNRCAQHNPINDYHGYRRVMHRVTLAGDKSR
jgi:taurine dioxygenase